MLRKSQRTRIALALLASALLLSGCLPREQQLPDPSVPHRLASPATLQILVRRADGSFVAETVTAPAGWWLASPQVVNP
jgi:hypothetical protein